MPEFEGTRGDTGDVVTCLDELERVGCKVRRAGERVSNVAVFDESLVWFGGIPPFAFAHADDCGVRIVNCVLAAKVVEAS